MLTRGRRKPKGVRFIEVMKEVDRQARDGSGIQRRHAEAAISKGI